MEAWRHRRTAYRSGRLELVGFEKDVKNPPNKRKKRKVRKKRFPSEIWATPFKGKFRWKVH